MMLPGHNAKLAPGMSQVLEAGEKYTIKDDKDGEIELDVRDRPWTIEFLSSFDNYMDAARRLGESHIVTMQFAFAMRDKWLTMPEDLRRLMPSARGVGVRVPGNRP